MRKNLLKRCLFYFALTFILCTCNDPIFYAISLEVEPIEPRIKGAPTNFAIYPANDPANARMYVASGGTLYTYGKDPEHEKAFWRNGKAPGGKILQIASTNEYLYALCSTDQNVDGKIVVRRFDGSTQKWEVIGGDINNSGRAQNIFAANDTLFIMASTYSDNNFFYDIFYINGDETESTKLTITDADSNLSGAGKINGAAYNGVSYFLCTWNRGVYRIDDFSAGASILNYQYTKIEDEVEIEVTENITFSGIINLRDNNNTILLIARNGNVYTIKDGIIKKETVSLGRNATGALAIWQKKDSPDRLLLAGRQDTLSYTVDSGYTYGYMELEIDAGGIVVGKNFVEPGKSALLSTVGSNERYHSTIGKNPVNYIFQAPEEIDTDMILFASTQKNGVWSYRTRGGDDQWNAEE
ncbi:MAG: hypothetical protein LBI04_02870 [Treponema sp.]|jgi:hypothetical protein|nr:hypothetical protein [Treponema sp.]